MSGRDRLLKVAEVAEHLGVSSAAVYGPCERGELPVCLGCHQQFVP
jgi:predicted DNA-binding transcriptional regulator AlpA